MHGCQNCDLNCKITLFYDPTSPKCLESHKNRKNCRITCRILPILPKHRNQFFFF